MALGYIPQALWYRVKKSTGAFGAPKAPVGKPPGPLGTHRHRLDIDPVPLGSNGREMKRDYGTS